MWGVGGVPEGDGETVFEVCRRRGLKFNAGKSKVMIMNGEDGLLVLDC